jgi:non-ribosomal peptide synthetase component F
MVAAKFDLTLVVAELETGIAGTFVYSTDLFDASTIAGMAERLEEILRDATGTDDGDAGAASKQTAHLLNAFNATLE